MAVYPGSFDPFTNGHRDILNRALAIFDRVIIAVTANFEKEHLFSIDERKEIIKNSITGLDRVEIDSFDGLLVNFMKKKSTNVIIKGLRAVSDFEYELQMALINRKLHPDFETVFLMTSAKYVFLSSSRVKEIASLGGDVSCFVSPFANEALKRKFGVGENNKS